MRVLPLPIVSLLALCLAAACGGKDTTAPSLASGGQVANVLVAPASNLVWTSTGQLVFWAPVYAQLTVSPVQLTAVDPQTLTWHRLETVDRRAERVSVSSDGSTAWFVDNPRFLSESDTFSVVYRYSMADGRADSVAESRSFRLSGLHGYARTVVAEPAGPGALYTDPPDSLWTVDDPAGSRTLLATACTMIQAISADGKRLLCSHQDVTDLVFVTLPGGETTPFDVKAASPSHFPQGFGFVDGALHVITTVAADSAWAVSEWMEETGTTNLLFTTSSLADTPGLAFLSGDGTRIAVWTEECLQPSYGTCLGGILARLYVFDRATGNVTVVARHHIPQGVRGGVVAFAPDDRRVAYAIWYALYIESLD